VAPRAAGGALGIRRLDDASDDGSCDELASDSAPPLRLVRNETPARPESTAGPTRRPRRGGVPRLPRRALPPSGRAGSPRSRPSSASGSGGAGSPWPRICSLRPDVWERDLASAAATGCTIAIRSSTSRGPIRSTSTGNPCTCTWEAGAWMVARSWYDHVGGLDRDMVYWGGENVDFPCARGSPAGTAWSRTRHPWATSSRESLQSDGRADDHVQQDPRPPIPSSRSRSSTASCAIWRSFPASGRLWSGSSRTMRRSRASRDTSRRSGGAPDRWDHRYVRGSPSSRPRSSMGTGGGRTVPRRRGVLSFSIILPWAGGGDGGGRAALEEVGGRRRSTMTAYGRYEILICGAGDDAAGGTEAWRREPFLGRRADARVLGPAGLGTLLNLGTSLSAAEVVAVLDPAARIIDEHWLESSSSFSTAARRPSWRARGRGMSTGRARRSRLRRSLRPQWEGSAAGFVPRAARHPAIGGPRSRPSAVPEFLVAVRREALLHSAVFDRDARRGPRALRGPCLQPWLLATRSSATRASPFARSPRRGGRASGRRRPAGSAIPSAPRPSPEVLSRTPRASRAIARGPRRGPGDRCPGIAIVRSRREFQRRARFDGTGSSTSLDVRMAEKKARRSVRIELDSFA